MANNPRTNPRRPDPGSAAADPPLALVKALTMLLRPLVGVLITRGITCTYLTELLKKLYVDVAHKDFALDGKKQTDSRISLISGVHRKDVRRLLAEPGAEPGPPKGVSVGARLIGIWIGSPAYVDELGRPRPLCRTTKDASVPSFNGLVESIKRKDVRARVVLDELVRLGVVHVDEEDLVHLNVDAFVPVEGFDELAYYFGRNLRDHIAAAAHNLSGGQPPFPERAVYYDRLTPVAVAELRGLSRKLAAEVLRTVNSEALRLADVDEGKPDAVERMTLGFYYFSGVDEKSKPPVS